MVTPCRPTMLRPTKGMGPPSPPPSLASAALWGKRATAAPRGWLRRDPNDQFAELDVTRLPHPKEKNCLRALDRKHPIQVVADG